jgi:hypothetical protein
MPFHWISLLRMATNGLLVLVFFYAALKGLLARKPQLIPGIWYFALSALVILPTLLFAAFHTNIPNLNLMTRTVSVMFLLLLWYIWKFFRLGFTILGISDKSFRKTLLAAISRLKLDYTEDMTGIHVKGSDLTLRTSILMGNGRVQIRGEGSPELSKNLGPVLRDELAKGGVEVDPTTSWLYLGFGLIFLVLLLFQWSLTQNIGRM